jgi:hypothetical protein
MCDGPTRGEGSVEPRAKTNPTSQPPPWRFSISTGSAAGAAMAKVAREAVSKKNLILLKRKERMALQRE